MKQKTLKVLILLISGFINPLYAQEASLSVENSWISEAPPVSKVMVAYMTINNKSSEAIDITKAESELYSSIEFHETIHEDGMARMVRHNSLNIPAGSRLELKRGGPHLMLFKPTKHLTAGDTVSIKLTTKNNATKTILVTVKKAQH